MFFNRATKEKSRLYHKRGESGRYRGYRIHLRVKEDGNGLLIINASRVLHLNRTATEFAKYLIEGKEETEAVKIICSKYRVKRDKAREDYVNLRDKILEIANSDDISPETFLGMERIEAFTTPLFAPYRSDVVLTYRCNNNCPHCYVGRQRPFPEMDTEQWKRVIKKLWDVGVPHITFTGGEPTLRKDLPQLVAYGEEIGMVTGVITNGRLLTKGMVDRLVKSGLDHIQITIESFNRETHNKMVGTKGWKETVNGIKNCLKTPLYVLTNTTITTDNKEEVKGTIDFLRTLGLKRFACNSIIYAGGGRSVNTGIAEEKIGEIVKGIKSHADSLSMEFMWYTPTRYCVFDPLLAGVGAKQCSAAKYNIAVEPNGNVIPCQSYFESMGNILTDSWDKIWNSDVAKYLRNREYVEEKCKVCPDLNVCGDGCPLYLKHKENLARCTGG
jgi:radical SAM protein with 4Fe4S-binding SPASM domain